jgi:hypothetical protein
VNNYVRLMVPVVYLLVLDQVESGLSNFDTAVSLVSKMGDLYADTMRMLGIPEDQFESVWGAAIKEIDAYSSYYGFRTKGGNDCPERDEDPLYSDRDYTTWGV